ncbi:hypothetical protein MN116_003085, partial [Schistosoma mekongi]
MNSINQYQQTIGLNASYETHNLEPTTNIASNHYLNKSGPINKGVTCKNTTMSVLQSVLQAGSIDSMPVLVTRCNACLMCLRELIRQAYDLIIPGSSYYSVILMKTPLSPAITSHILESLKLPDHPLAKIVNDRCASCATRFIQLKIDALSYVRRSVLSTTTEKLTRISPDPTRLNVNQMNNLPGENSFYQLVEADNTKMNWLRASKPNDQNVQSSQLHTNYIPVSDNSILHNSTQHIFRLEGSLHNSQQNHKTLGFKLINSHFKVENHTTHYSHCPTTEVNKFQEPIYQTSLTKTTCSLESSVVSHIQGVNKLSNNLTSSNQQVLQRTYIPTVYNYPTTVAFHHTGIQSNIQTNSNYIRTHTNQKIDDSPLYTELNCRKTEFHHLNPIGETIKNKSHLSCPNYSRSIRWAAEKGLISTAKQQQILWESSREKTSQLQLMQSYSEDLSTNNRGEINPSIVNIYRRLDSEFNESSKDENSKQDKITNQLIQSNNKGGLINQQPTVTQISAAASFFTRAGQKLTVTSSSKRKRKLLSTDISDVKNLSGYNTLPSCRHSQQSKCITGFAES